MPPSSAADLAFAQLISEASDTAFRLLEDFGEFYPIAFVQETNGNISSLTVHGGDEQPAVEQVIADLTEILRRKAASGSITAAVVCTDVLVGERQEQDALRFSLEHISGVAGEVFLPYQRLPDGLLSYDDNAAYWANRQSAFFS